MYNTKVKDFMIPVDRFPRISRESTFAEAVQALEKARPIQFSAQKKQRILLVEDGNHKIVGKLTLMDLIRGLEPHHKTKHKKLAETYDRVVKTAQEQALLSSKPLDILYPKTQNIRIRDFIRPPGEHQIVKPDDSLNRAFHHFVHDNVDFLYVKDQGRLLGLLLFSDISRIILQEIKKLCNLGDSDEPQDGR